MKFKLLVFTALLLSLNTINAQPIIEWKECLGGGGLNGYDKANAVEQTTDGGYIITGTTDSNNGDVSGNNGWDDFWVVKLDAAGSIEWQKCLGGSNQEIGSDVIQTSDGGYLVTGWSVSNDGLVSGNHGSSDAWVVKLDSSGNLVWQKSIGGIADDEFSSVVETTDGGYVLAGKSNSADGDVPLNNGSYDFYIVKLNGSGTLIWKKSFGGSEYDEAISVIQTNDGGFLVGGTTSSSNVDVSGNHGSSDFWLLKLFNNGSLAWSRTYGGSQPEMLSSVQKTTDGGYILCGYSFSSDGDVLSNHGEADAWIVKVNEWGIIQWQQSQGGTDTDIAHAIEQTSDNVYIYTGFSSSNDGDVTGNHGLYDYLIVKLSNTGTIEWQKSLGGTSTDIAYDIKETSDQGYIVVGESTSNNGDATGNHGTYDFWVVKLGNGTGMNEQDPVSGFQAYPNPCTDELTIISDHSLINKDLLITNELGIICFEGTIDAAKYNLNVGHLAKGIYFLHIEGDQETIKLIKE